MKHDTVSKLKCNISSLVDQFRRKLKMRYLKTTLVL